MASRRDKFWTKLDSFRISRGGVLLFYGYLIAILIAAFLIAFAIRNNHRLALEAKAAAAKANAAAASANRSLCFEKQANLSELHAAEKFWRQHPNGTPDFSRVLIMNALRTAEVNVAAFRDVHCSR